MYKILCQLLKINKAIKIIIFTNKTEMSNKAHKAFINNKKCQIKIIAKNM